MADFRQTFLPCLNSSWTEEQCTRLNMVAGWKVAVYVVLPLMLLCIAIALLCIYLKRRRLRQYTSMKKARGPVTISPSRTSIKSHQSSSESSGTPLAEEFWVPVLKPGGGEGSAVELVGSQVQPFSRRRPSMSARLENSSFDPNSEMYKRLEMMKTKEPTIEYAGELHFALHYNKDMGILTIRLIQARDLQPREFSGTADPYFKISVLPDEPRTLQSKIHRKTLDPEFEEKFAFEIPPTDLPNRTIRFLLFDYDQFSRDECVGQVLLPLENVDLSERVELWKMIESYKIRTPEKKPDLGDLLMTASYLPTAERLTIVILKARGLENTPHNKRPDPYVKVSILYAGKRLKKKKTSTRHSTTNPVYNEALVFDVGREFMDHVYIELVIVHENRFGQNQGMGKVVLSAESEGEELEHWKSLAASRKGTARWHCLQPLQPD
ncbi:synaptotagmin-5-like isoform X2 [Branchiostoma floridae]|uniref:Synaptotagmin-5-like isoform X2 n=1 Tax=Branchiostoma floridae TaxID=7739 RepID=A0A9J7MW67_BRAFL|nr:synaptotagmin-5-like isoform X2 [Branchiostoma floridae]